jgi:hypothetical protein
MENPIRPATRSKIYLVGAVAAIIFGSTITGFAMYGLVTWIPLVTLVSTTVAALSALLARSYIDFNPDATAKKAEEKAVTDANVERDLKFAALAKQEETLPAPEGDHRAW